MQGVSTVPSVSMSSIGYLHLMLSRNSLNHLCSLIHTSIKKFFSFQLGTQPSSICKPHFEKNLKTWYVPVLDRIPLPETLVRGFLFAVGSCFYVVSPDQKGSISSFARSLKVSASLVLLRRELSIFFILTHVTSPFIMYVSKINVGLVVWDLSLQVGLGQGGVCVAHCLLWVLKGTVWN